MEPAPAASPASRPAPDRATLVGEGVSWAARWSLRILSVAAGLALIGFVISEFWSIAFPIFIGLIVASVFEPFVSWLRAHGWPSLLATIVVFVVFLAIIAGIVAALIPTVAAQGPQIAQGAAAGVERIQDLLAGPPFNLGRTSIGQAVSAATERLQQNATTIAGQVVTGLTAVAGGVIDAVLALVLAFLFVKDGPRFLPWLTRYVGPNIGGHLDQVGRRCWGRLGGFIRSQAIIGFCDSACIGIGLLIFGVPLALPLAVLTFFGAFIPIVGALVAGILSVLVALVIKGFGTAIGVLILIIAVQQIEGNLLQPLVQGRGLGLHAAVVILAVAGGGGLFGIAGAFLAVPIVAVAAEVLRYLTEQIDQRVDRDAEIRAAEEGSGGPAVRGEPGVEAAPVAAPDPPRSDETQREEARREQARRGRGWRGLLRRGNGGPDGSPDAEARDGAHDGADDGGDGTERDGTPANGTQHDETAGDATPANGTQRDAAHGDEAGTGAQRDEAQT